MKRDKQGNEIVFYVEGTEYAKNPKEMRKAGVQRWEWVERVNI